MPTTPETLGASPVTTVTLVNSDLGKHGHRTTPLNISICPSGHTMASLKRVEELEKLLRDAELRAGELEKQRLKENSAPTRSNHALRENDSAPTHPKNRRA